MFSKNNWFPKLKFNFLRIEVPIQGEMVLSNKNKPGKIKSL
jgi:hypothetical protein